MTTSHKTEMLLCNQVTAATCHCCSAQITIFAKPANTLLGREVTVDSDCSIIQGSIDGTIHPLAPVKQTADTVTTTLLLVSLLQMHASEDQVLATVTESLLKLNMPSMTGQ